MSFTFDSYDFNETEGIASFRYSDGGERKFTEKISFYDVPAQYNREAFERALFLTFILIGTSYYKTFPTQDVVFRQGALDEWQAKFFSTVYQEGMSQFAFENKLTRDDLAHFAVTTSAAAHPVSYTGEGILALQSGGKDSLLTAALLEERGISFDPMYISSADTHPVVLDQLSGELHIVHRRIDRGALRAATEAGGRNGHVPVTYIVLATATLQAILLGKDTILASIGHEGEEAHAFIGDLPVNHQWSKTWPAEQRFAEYVCRYIAPTLRVGSPLRSLSELRITQLFAEHAWQRFGHEFSSCNLGNYIQGADNASLTWCGDCPKCANAYLLFAPYISHEELIGLFGGQDLFERSDLQDTFRGLLGIDGVMKPFECVGEVDELRYAYHLSDGTGVARLSFEVPVSTFDEARTYDAQLWATQLLESTPGTM